MDQFTSNQDQNDQRPIVHNRRIYFTNRNASFCDICLKNGKWLPDFIERLKASAWHQLYLPLLPFTHARFESINADSLKLQLLTARKKEWWPATADSLSQAVYLTTVKHTALAGIEPTTFRSWVRRATSLPVVPPRPPAACRSIDTRRERKGQKCYYLRLVEYFLRKVGHEDGTLAGDDGQPRHLNVSV